MRRQMMSISVTVKIDHLGITYGAGKKGIRWLTKRCFDSLFCNDGKIMNLTEQAATYYC